MDGRTEVLRHLELGQASLPLRCAKDMSGGRVTSLAPHDCYALLLPIHMLAVHHKDKISVTLRDQVPTPVMHLISIQHGS